jgi:4-amino-4-deoxy-L-arabinose transferase-like glycosyltransferase
MTALYRLKPFVAVLLISIALRVFLIDTSYVFWDEAEYLMNAELIATGDSPYGTMDYRPPVLPVLLSFTHPAGEYFERLVMVLLNSLAVLFAYLIGRRWNELTGIIAALLFAIWPFHLLYSHYIMTDSLAMMLCMASYYFYTEGLHGKGNPWRAFFGASMLFIAILTKFTSLAFLPVLLMLFWMERSKYRLILLSLSQGALLLVPYLVFNLLSFGSPFHPFLHGYSLVDIEDKASMALFLILDLLNPLLIMVFLLALGLVYKRKDKGLYIQVFWFFLMFSVFLLLVNKGVDKPPGMEWLAERFLLPALPPFLLLCSFFLSRLAWRQSLVIISIVVLLGLPAYQRLLVPAVELEDGLRSVTRLVAEDVKQLESPVYCYGNCPSVAYYSGKKIHIIHDKDNLEGLDLPDAYTLTFSQTGCHSQAYSSGSWSACLQVNQLVSDLRK